MEDQTGAAQDSLELLADWAEGRLTPERSAEVEASVAADPELQASARWVLGLLELSRSIPSPEPSPLVHQRLQQHFTRWAKAQQALGESPYRYRAQLLLDSSQNRALVGVRGSSDAINFVFGSDVGDVVFDVFPAAPGRVRLLGQVMLNEATGAPIFEATARLPDGRALRCESDKYGRFRLNDLSAAPTEILVSNGEVEIRATLPLERTTSG